MARSSLPMFRRGPGGKPETKWGRQIDFTDPQRIITLHPFTVTAVNCTPAIAHVGDRPAVSLAGAGAAGDGAQFQCGVAGIRPQAGETIVFGGTWRSADPVNHEFQAGFAVVDTSLIASVTTDYFHLNKLATETVFSLETRKASGTALVVACSTEALVADTWYRYEVWATRDPSTAGKCRYIAYFGLDANSQIPAVANGTFPTQFPDTVSLAPFFAMLEGDTGTDATAVSRFGWDCFYDNLQA